MIKFERRNTDKAVVAQRSLCEQKAKNGTYNTPEVNAALIEMFYGKCYICEIKDATSYQIEHLVPHKGDLDLKFDWSNLFWSCAHCNNIKNAKYNPILDCSKEDIDKKIAFRKDGFFGTTERLVFKPLDDSKETINTVALLEEVYNGNTPQKKLEAINIRRKLRTSLSNFKNLVREYYDTDGYDKEDILLKIKMDVQSSSEFAAFKRWLLWDNSEIYDELIRRCHL